MTRTDQAKETLLTTCLLGGALGDTLGLPAEGMHARRTAKLWKDTLRQRMFFGNGMVSDDTEHAVMTLLALQKSNGDPTLFARHLAWSLRWWFAGLPAGIGLATARSCIKLWLCWDCRKSGVFSAGNGPLMRAPIIAAYYPDDAKKRTELIATSTRITHSDPRALEAAVIVAAATIESWKGNTNTHSILGSLEELVTSDEMKVRFRNLKEAISTGQSVSQFADSFGRKTGYVNGFAPDTAAVAIYAWLRHRNDFSLTIRSVIMAGGDTDTVAFVAGSIAGIGTPPDDLPVEWLGRIVDWPINPTYMSEIARGKRKRYPPWPLSIIRNLFFLLIVLLHAFRRIFPPYR